MDPCSMASSDHGIGWFMDAKKRLTLSLIWGTAVLAMIGLVGTGVAYRQLGDSSATLEVLYDAPDFELIDQNNRTITQADLRGNVYVAMVFFASCPGVCPAMNAKLLEMQKAVPLPDVKIVSISLDPKNDKPEMLKGYAEGLGADQSRWYFLTGEQDAIFATAKAFGLAAAPAEPGGMITHTQKVLLIDRQNRVRGVYDSLDADAMKKLAEDAKKLAAEKETAS